LYHGTHAISNVSAVVARLPTLSGTRFLVSYQQDLVCPPTQIFGGVVRVTGLVGVPFIFGTTADQIGFVLKSNSEKEQKRLIKDAMPIR
jgi:hypothetical protein